MCMKYWYYIGYTAWTLFLCTTSTKTNLTYSGILNPGSMTPAKIFTHQHWLEWWSSSFICRVFFHHLCISCYCDLDSTWRTHRHVPRYWRRNHEIIQIDISSHTEVHKLLADPTLFRLQKLWHVRNLTLLLRFCILRFGADIDADIETKSKVENLLHRWDPVRSNRTQQIRPCMLSRVKYMLVRWLKLLAQAAKLTAFSLRICLGQNIRKLIQNIQARNTLTTCWQAQYDGATL